MKKYRIMFLISLALLLPPMAALAADFDWTRNFNLKAGADMSDFRARLAIRFRIGDAQISAVIGNVEKPADAYIVFRMAEISSQPVNRVIHTYRSDRGKGWGVIAQKLGIKPGSKEFHALKRGSDLYDPRYQTKPKDKDKDKGKSKKQGS